MYANAKMTPVETAPGIKERGWGREEEGGIQVGYI
jgi:hypothetical protein